jgi:hypothetical protein
VGEAVVRRKQLIKELLVEEAGGCCAVCGYDRCIINLVFHHVDPEQKSFSLSMNTTKSLAAYREEMEKCVLLCANCHGEVEAGLLVGPPAGAKYEDVLHIYGGPIQTTTDRVGPRGLEPRLRD